MLLDGNKSKNHLQISLQESNLEMKKFYKLSSRILDLNIEVFPPILTKTSETPHQFDLQIDLVNTAPSRPPACLLPSAILAA